jgi:hypothetical protein
MGKDASQQRDHNKVETHTTTLEERRQLLGKIYNEYVEYVIFLLVLVY